MSGSEQCVGLVEKRLLEHFGADARSDARNLLHIVCGAKKVGLRSIACGSFWSWLSPTFIATVLVGGAVLRIGARAPLRKIHELRTRGRRYAVVILSSAYLMYGTDESWAHAIVFTGEGFRTMSIYDPLGEIEPEASEVLQLRTLEQYMGRGEAVCLIFYR
jgi:hypothetical protein